MTIAADARMDVAPGARGGQDEGEGAVRGLSRIGGALDARAREPLCSLSNPTIYSR
jgi:hypothetical protein